MPFDVDKYRAAGFSDQEIADYAFRKRQKFEAAGFPKEEIDAYFANGPVMKPGVPQAVTDRMAKGEDFLQQLMSKPYSERIKEWSAQKLKEGNYPAVGLGIVTSGLAGIPEVIAQGVQATGKAIQGKLSPEEELSTSFNLAAFLGLGGYMHDAAGAHPLFKGKDGQLVRPIQTPTGELKAETIGPLPESKDFATATKAVAGDNVQHVQDKLTDAYNNQGVHPVEAAADATDPVKKQQLLSSDTGVSPYVKDEPKLPGDYDQLPTLPEPKPTGQSLLQFLRARGGLQPDADLKSIFGGNKLDIIRKNGMSLDRAREAAVEAGYLQEDTPGSSSIRDFLDLVDQENRGNKVFPAGELSADNKALSQARGALEADLTAEVQALGVDYDKLPKQMRDRALYIMYTEGKDAFSAYEQAVMEADHYAGESGAVPASKSRNEPARASGPGVSDQGVPGSGAAGAGARTTSPHEAGASGEINGTVKGPQGKLPIGPGGKPPQLPPEPPETPPTPYSYNDASKIISSKIGVGGQEPARKLTLSKLYTRFLDDLHPLGKADEWAYKVARLTRGNFGKAQEFLDHGTFDFTTHQTTGDGLKQILSPLSSRADVNAFRNYIASKRALEIDKSGRQSGFDTFAAQEVVSHDAERFEPIAQKLQNYQSELLRYLKDSGVLSPESYDKMLAASKDYVPFYRIMGEYAESVHPGAGRKGFGPGSPIKKLEGSERAIVDPIESIVKNTYAYISIAERNAVGQQIVEALRQEGYGAGELFHPKLDAKEITDYLRQHGIEEPPEQLVQLMQDLSAKDGGDTISAWKNGKRESVRVGDPELVTAFRNLDAQTTGALIKLLKVPASMLRAGATITPDFIVKNLLRDFFTAFVNTGGAVFSPIDTAKGLTGVLTKDTDFHNWMKAGGGNSTWVALDRRYLQESLHKLSADTGLMQRGINVVNSPFRALRMMSELAENATRLGEYKKVAKTLPDTKEGHQAAAYSAREVTLDFSRMGTAIRSYNMISAFFNANLQGTDRIIRSFKANPTATTLRIAAGITIPSIALWAYNNSTPEFAKRYQEIPQWERDLFWIIQTEDHIYRIPKPFEVGVAFGSGAERMLEAYFADNPKAFDQFTKSVWNALAPNFLPTALSPLVDQYANRANFTDRTLIPDQLEKQLPEYQYTPYTSELAKKIGSLISAFPGMRDEAIGNDMLSPTARAITSPILIENYIRAWSGGMGMYMLQASDAALRKAGLLPDPPKPSDTLADVPFVKSFVVRYPTASAQSIQDFYDSFNRNEVFYNTFKAKAKDGDFNAIETIMKAGGDGIFARLTGIKKTLSEQSQLVRNIYKDPSTSPDEKRQMIDGIYYQMINAARMGIQMQRQMDKAFTESQVPSIPQVSVPQSQPQPPRIQ